MNPQKTVLYVLGGYGKDYSIDRFVSRYDPEIDSWNTLPTKTPFRRSDFGCVSIDNDIFVIGGSNGSWPMKTVFKLNTETSEWSEFPPMKYCRSGCGAVCSADSKYIYVAGGRSPFGDWDGCIVERFSIDTYEWTTVKPMGVDKHFVEFVELGGFVYAVGGHDKSAERYDPETDQWSSIALMKHEHSHGFGATVLNGKIYVLGENGFEMYSPEDDQWTELPAPTFLVRWRKLVALNGELLAVGGRTWEDPKNSDTVVYMNVVECFDVKKQTWSRKPDMDIGRADHSVVVVSKLSNNC